MSRPVLVALAGKLAGHRNAVIQTLKPAIEVTHQLSTSQEIKDFLRSLPDDSASTGGVSAVIVGGGFSPTEFEDARSIPEAKRVAWLRVDPHLQAAPANGKYPSAEEVAVIAKKGCDAHMDDLVNRRGIGEVWMI